MITIGASLRALRLSRNIPAKCVAEDMGIDRPTLSHLERGDADVRLSTLRRWAAALGLRIVLVEENPNTTVSQSANT